jgi:hypothetical protein
LQKNVSRNDDFDLQDYQNSCQSCFPAAVSLPHLESEEISASGGGLLHTDTYVRTGWYDIETHNLVYSQRKLSSKEMVWGSSSIEMRILQIIPVCEHISGFITLRLGRDASPMSLIDLADLSAAGPPAPNIVAANPQSNAAPQSSWDAVFGPGITVPATNGASSVPSQIPVQASVMKPVDLFNDITLFAPAASAATISAPSTMATSGSGTLSSKPADIFDGFVQIPHAQGQMSSALPSAAPSRGDQSMRQLLEKQDSQPDLSERLEVSNQESLISPEVKKPKKPTRRRVMTANDLQAFRKQAEADAAAEGKEVDTSDMVSFTLAAWLMARL